LLVGITGAFCFLYGFQTRIPLPLWVLNAFNHPWVIFLAFLFIIFISEWDDKIGAFLLLILVAVVIDHTIFMRRYKNLTDLPTQEDTTDNKKVVNINYNNMYLESNTINTDKASNAGPSVLQVPNDVYPIFYGHKEPEIGPAPF
jgi:hypothetical protein